MQKLLLGICLFCLFGTSSSLAAIEDPTFKHHTFEIAVTPAVDYHFVTNTNNSTNYKQAINNIYRPFLGANLGLSYIYRPISFFGISTGVNYIECVYKMGKTATTMNGYSTGYVYFNGYIQSGSLSVPILLHGFYPIKKVTLEFATGPEFLFPLYNKAKYTQSAYSNILPAETYNQTEKYTTQLMRKYSQFVWDVQLNICLPIKNNFYLGIGPELKFLNIRPFNPSQFYSSQSHVMEFYAGIKFSFRISTDFKSKSTNSKPNPSNNK